MQIMRSEKNIAKAVPGLGFKLLKRYIRICHNDFYYRKVYWLNTENIPEECPLMIVSDHQNGLSDVLGILMSIRSRNKRKIKVIARADIFNTVFGSALRWLGLLPAFRTSFDGEESLANNDETFAEAENELFNNGTVVIFPEAGHQDKRWLGKFTSGYTRILFEAAAKSNFEKEIFVLPSCNHYSDYFTIQEKLLIKYGTPISIAPFYELYKTKPRTAQRQVNALVREQISDMMLNITDLDNYEAIDYLRNGYGVEFAKKQGFNPDKLPDKLTADKQLFAKLENIKTTNEAELQKIYNDVNILKEKTEQLKIKDSDFDKKSIWNIILKGFMLALLFPIFVLAYIPNSLIFYARRLVVSKVKNKMLQSSVTFGVSILISMPMSYCLILVLIWIRMKSLIVLFLTILFCPILGIFAWYYIKWYRNWIRGIRFHKLSGKAKMNDLITLRTNINESLNRLLKQENQI